MTSGRRNPAIYAGLLGAAMGFYPTKAVALPLEDLITSPSAPYIQFALGVIAGAALSTAVHIAIAATNENRAYKALLEMQKAAQAQAPEKTSESQAEVHDTPAGAQQTQKPVAASKAPARHMAAREWEASGVIRVQDVPVKHLHQPSEAEEAPAAVEGETTKPPAHVATDYSDIAENYVRRKSFRERMSARTSGVAVVLGSRLGTNPFEGLPVIERADGTVGDVGTSWWNKTLGSSVRRIEDIGKEGDTRENFESVDSVPSFERVEDIPASAPMPQTGPLLGSKRAAAHFALNAEASRRADYISKNVAEVNVGIYPEHRTADDLEREDVWDLALKAMDERLANQGSVVFSDAVGTIETIDEPDGLEGATTFIPFKVHAGHPEMVDTNSYVDYLIDDEFSHNPSPIARRTSRDYLTIIQGGSDKPEPEAAEEERVYRPKHFAPEHLALAREA